MSPHSTRERWVVPTSEFRSTTLPRWALSDRDLETLAGIRADLVRCSPTSSGWTLRTGPVCGVIELDGCTVTVRPKLMPDGTAVVSWISYALAAPVELSRMRQWLVGDDGLREVVVAALVRECRTLLRDGLRRDYRREQTVDTVLRGRLDIGRQLSRRFGQVDQLHLDRFDREVEIWENLVLRAALDVATKTSAGADLRRAAADVARGFPDCTWASSLVRRRLSSARYHRMNVRYRPSHIWAGLLLGGGGVSDLLCLGPAHAGSLLVDMTRLWELVVLRLSREFSSDGGKAAQTENVIRVTEDGYRPRTFRPDAFLAAAAQRGGVRVLPIDAKYKDYGSEPVDRNDAHQLLTYATAYAGPHDRSIAVLVHPTTGGNTRRTLQVRAAVGHLGTIHVVGVDTGGAPADAALHLHVPSRP